MATVGNAELPVPGGGDAPVGPGALAALAAAIDPHLIQHVADQAERDAEYAAAPLHTLVSAENGSLWIKTSATANTWATIHEPEPAWRPVTPAAGYSADVYTPQVRRIGNEVHLRGRIVRTDGTVFPLSGVKIADVPSDAIPAVYGSFSGTASLVGDPTIGVGRIEVIGALQSNSFGSAGSVVWFSQDGTGVTWVDISGIYWLD